ncbi:protease modulator HflC [Sedimentisphaera salicampi]|uniref:Protein HflC n=1 Tax=Sedimentisphaera salicampi TaxID=1941349 RepID=A0A1W6LJZ3_9BACT|nr:protease modulator HflC [Sedimentisphaera salicampi]ARN56072.1 Modulator of FtsH protease HflC [Sedimentisphaera salicampi]
MRRLPKLILVTAIVVLLGFKLCSYQVRETESALITRFGKPIAEKTEPGLYFKLPTPFDVVHKFDSRLQVFEGQQEETTTKGGEPVIITPYMIWKISQPQHFFERVSTDVEVQKFLLSQLRNHANAVVGKHYFSEFVNTDPDKIKFDQIENELLQALKESTEDEYGITVDSVGIKKLELNEEVTQAVFERMRADRQRKKEDILGEGRSTATRIRTDADKKKQQLLAAVESRVIAIKGEGDAGAAKYYKMLQDDPELAMYLRDLEALAKILENRSTVVLGAETDPMKLLREVPELESSKPKDSKASQQDSENKEK